MKKVLLCTLKILAVALFWLVIWLLLAKKVDNDFLFPAPQDVWKSFSGMVRTGAFWIKTAASLLRVLTGILLSWLIGCFLAILISASRIADALLRPLLTVIKATPVASFIVLALLWMERDSLPVFITSLIVIPIVTSNVSEGIRSVDRNLWEVTKVFGFSFPQKCTRLYLPSVAPFFLAACKSSLGMAWKASIAAEVLCTPKNAIGTELYFSKTYLETSELFAWTLVIILLSMVIEKLLVSLLENAGKKFRLISRGNDHDRI